MIGQGLWDTLYVLDRTDVTRLKTQECAKQTQKDWRLLGEATSTDYYIRSILSWIASRLSLLGALDSEPQHNRRPENALVSCHLPYKLTYHSINFRLIYFNFIRTDLHFICERLRKVTSSGYVVRPCPFVVNVIWLLGSLVSSSFAADFNRKREKRRRRRGGGVWSRCNHQFEVLI